MIVGHIAAGLALKRADPEVPLGALLLAAMLPDLVLGVLVLAGIERIAVPDNYADLRYFVYVFPYSHGLAANLSWAAGAFLAGWLAWRRIKMAALAALAVFSHFLLDFAVHVPELPLAGPGSPVVGLGLRESLVVATALDGVVLAAGLGLYLTSPAARRGGGRTLFLAMLVVLAAVLALGGQWLSPVAPNIEVVAVLLIVPPVFFAAAGYWLEQTERRGRQAARPDSFARRLIDLLTGKGRRRAEDVTEEDEEELEEEGEEEIEEGEEGEQWPIDRLAFLDKLWGEGFLTPGGGEYTIEFVQLLSLNDTKSILNLNAGLGGPARAMVDEHGVWVTAMEANPELAEKGNEMSLMAGVAKKASVIHYDPEEAKFKERGFNAVVAQEGLYTVVDKENLFKAIEACLRVDGILLFTDFVLPKAGAPSEELQRWYDSEPVKPRLWTANQTASFISNLPSMELHVAEDISAAYKKRVIKDWYAYVETLTKADLTPQLLALIIRECESWMHRIAALDSGGLRIYRYEAVKLPPKRPDI